MIQFNEEGQNKTFEKLRQREEEAYRARLADSLGLPFIDLTTHTIQTTALRTVSEDEARKGKIAPFHLVNKTLHVGLVEPTDKDAKHTLQKLESEKYDVKQYVTTKASLEKALGLFKEISRTSQVKRGAIRIDEKNIDALRERINSINDVGSMIDDLHGEDKNTKISQFVEIILGGALSVGASDVHCEPEDDQVRIRYRLDGILTTIANITHETYEGILSRVKLSSGMKLNVKNESQDGRFTIHAKETEIEVRSSVVPGPYGDSIVMRILDPESIQVSLEELGIHPNLLEIFRAQIKKPNGMILNTGPTGSGKTTTLYSFLREVNSADVKILTIENPIEYHLEGVVQTQVDRSKGYDFLSGLRSALRQDPDVIMVGEVRDEETANTAINAALTGHLVFSTLHTNDAAGTFPRLIDLGVDEKLISSAVNMAMAQRLVRKLCDNCKEKIVLEGNEKKLVMSIVEDLRERNETYLEGVQFEHIWKANGCDQCNNTGYKGRIGVFEAVLSDKSLEEALRENPSIREIWGSTKDQGIPRMREDGVLKALDGITSLDELQRVVELT